MTLSPWFKFYPGDWRSDPALRVCSLAARGLWMEMLCIMHEAIPRGWLRVNDKPVTDRQLAALAGISAHDVRKHVVELKLAGVFSQEGDTLFSRRMVRDTEKGERDKANGKAGGNPQVNPKGGVGVNPPVNPPVKAGDKAYILELEARSQEGSLRSPSAGAAEIPQASRRDAGWHERIEVECRAAAGLEQDPSPALFDISPIVTLLDQGYDFARDILPKLRAAKATGKRGRTWAYYVPGIVEGYAANGKIAPKTTPSQGPSMIWVSDDDPRWPALAALWLERRGKPVPKLSGMHGKAGQGWYFAADMLADNGAAA